LTDIYPTTAAERDRWILARRPARNPVDPRRPFAFLLEEERTESGEIVQVATIFLTNRECPWRCLMCDLWKNTLNGTVPVGAVPAQIDDALEKMMARGDPRPRLGQVKLYNSGSFFDPRAISVEDYPAIAKRVDGFERVVVECHPALVGDRCLEFRDLLNDRDKSRSSRCEEAQSSESGIRNPQSEIDRKLLTSAATKLEVAMGLETAHPKILEKLNKRMTLDDFRRAADFLRTNDIAMRAFVLVKPPFIVDESESLRWTKRSIDFAFDCGATVVSLIPVREGNGALEELARLGEFSPPRLETLEAAADYGVSLQRGRVFADLWDLKRFSDCSACLSTRRNRLHGMNLRQEVLPKIGCEFCET
jgi:uncharacterized Fe-S cluster-containing MiaB family protein